MSDNQLWKLYKKNKSKELKDTLIIKYIELVKIIAGRLYNSYNSYIEYEDLVSYGIIGLIDAIDKFDPDKNVKFETYANFRIRGSIIDQLRTLDWVPRSTRQKYKRLESVLNKLQNKYGLDINDSLIAKELGVSEKELNHIFSEVSILSVVSLDEKMADNNNFNIVSDDDESKPEETFLKSETKQILRQTIKKLPDREQKLINLYYFSQLTYKEIANILDISESRVSQIHTKCIIKLRNSLNNIFD